MAVYLIQVRLKYISFEIIFLLIFAILGMTNAEVLSQVEHGYRMPMPPNCTPALYEIMLECWHKVKTF